MCRLLKGLNIRKPKNESGKQQLQNLIDAKDDRLFKENYFLLEDSIDYYFYKSNIVYEAAYLKSYGVVTIHKNLSKSADRKSSFLVKSSITEHRNGDIVGKI